MRIQTSTYVSVASPVHSCDARVKIALLLAFTVSLFFVETWPGVAAFSAATLAVMVASRVPLGRYFGTIVPVYVLAAFSVLFNAFVSFQGAGDALLTLGPLTLYASGLSRGCLFAVRMVLLCLGSMVVCYTSTATELTGALGSILQPCRKLGLPVDDITTALSIALRFIPLLAMEVERAHDARWSRGANFDGSLVAKLRNWGGVFVPVFVGVFRRADRLAEAMDARCYGMPGVRRTALGVQKCSPKSLAVFCIGLTLFVLLPVFL